MADLKQIKKSMKTTSNWVANRQAIHIKRMTSAVDSLQNNIVNIMAELSVNKGGKLSAMRLNLKKLSNIHKDVILAFEKDFNGAAKVVTNDFLKAQDNIIAGYKDLDEIVKFTGADRKMMNVLKDSAYKEYTLIGGQTQEKVIQSMYNNVLSGSTMADLTNEIRNALTGIKGKDGRPLINYARLYANDMIMNFHNDVNLTKGLSIGMDRFLYYGTIMASSRDFCKRRVGQAYAKKQIDSWKGSRAGKRGDAWTFRGGWNCRHHWQPVRKKWLKRYDPIEMQNYFTETGQKIPKPVLPWGQKPTNPVPVKKGIVEPSPSRVASKMPKMPSIESLKADIRALYRTDRMKEIRFELKRKYDQRKEIKSEVRTALEEHIKVSKEKGIKKDDKTFTKWRKAVTKQIKLDTVISNLEMEMKNRKALLIRNKIKPPAGGKLKKIVLDRNFDLKKKEDFAFSEKGLVSMFHPDVLESVSPVNIQRERNIRAFYKRGSKLIKIADYKNSRALIHEFSHHIEFELPNAKQTALEFLKKRTKGEKLTKIFPGVEGLEEEVGWRDEFFEHYCGKDYGGKAIEIISMGVEKMYMDPYDFYISDPEYFSLILRVMWGEI